MNIVNYPHRFPLLTLTLFTALSLVRAEENFDPADQITTFTLTAEEEKTCRQDFEKLAVDDFDTREKALNRLASKGPAVLPLAQEYSNHADTEIATQAKGLH